MLKSEQRSTIDHLVNTTMTWNNKKVLTACYYALKNMFGTFTLFFTNLISVQDTVHQRTPEFHNSHSVTTETPTERPKYSTFRTLLTILTRNAFLSHEFLTENILISEKLSKSI